MFCVLVWAKNEPAPAQPIVVSTMHVSFSSSWRRKKGNSLQTKIGKILHATWAANNMSYAKEKPESRAAIAVTCKSTLNHTAVCFPASEGQIQVW